MDIELESPEEEANEQRKADGDAKPQHHPIIEEIDGSFKAVGSIFAKDEPPLMTDELREDQDEESRESDIPNIL